MVALLGSAGDKLAKRLGCSDGAMPMYAKLPGDWEPCDECARGNILVVETDPPKDGGDTVRKIKPAGTCALVSRKVVCEWLKGSEDKLAVVMEKGVMCVDHETAEWLGMHKEAEDA